MAIIYIYISRSLSEKQSIAYAIFLLDSCRANIKATIRVPLVSQLYNNKNSRRLLLFWHQCSEVECMHIFVVFSIDSILASFDVT